MLILVNMSIYLCEFSKVFHEKYGGEYKLFRIKNIIIISGKDIRKCDYELNY